MIGDFDRRQTAAGGARGLRQPDPRIAVRRAELENVRRLETSRKNIDQLAAIGADGEKSAIGPIAPAAASAVIFMAHALVIGLEHGGDFLIHSKFPRSSSRGHTVSSLHRCANLREIRLTAHSDVTPTTARK